MLRFSNAIALINEWIGRAISWLTVVMVLVTFSIVVLRYVFNTGWIAMQESVIYMHALVFMLGAAYTLNKDGHVRVDIFYSKMSANKKAVVDILGNILFLIPVCIFIYWSSWEYVTDSWELKESSREAGGLPWIYLLKITILLMPALLIIQAIANMARDAHQIMHKKDNDNKLVDEQ